MQPLSDWNSNPGALLHAAIFCLESQSLQATLQMPVWNSNPCRLLSMQPLSVLIPNPYRLLSECLFGIPILAGDSPCSHCLFGIPFLTGCSPNVCLVFQTCRLLSMQPLSVWNSNPYMLLSKCLLEIQVLTCYSPNVCLEFQSFHAALQMSGIPILTCFFPNVCLESQSFQANYHEAIVCLVIQPKRASLQMSVLNPSPYKLLSRCLFGIPILTFFSLNNCLESQSLHASYHMSVWIPILHASLQMSVWNHNPYMLLIKVTAHTWAFFFPKNRFFFKFLIFCSTSYYKQNNAK